MYLPPLGGGTHVHLIIRLAIIIHKVIVFIAKLTNNINLSVIKPSQREIFS